MAQVTRLNIAQQGGGSKTVAFTDDIKLNALTQGNLILVNTTDKTATVAVDSSKLSLNATDGNVVVNTPLELAIETTTPTDDGKLHAVRTGSTVKLYWGSNVIEAHDPEEGYVTTQEFNEHTGNVGTAKHLTAEQVTLVGKIPTTGTVATEARVEEIIDGALVTVEGDIDELKSVTSGYTGQGTIKTAVDAAQGAADNAQAAADAAQATADDAAAAAAAADTKAQGAVDAIGAWTTISDKTVKAAIEENKAEIANGLNEVKAGTSGTGVTVTVGTKTNKSQTVAVSVQDGTTTQKGIVQLADAHNASDSTKAATGSTVASAISTFDANVIGSWTAGGKYTGTVKSAIESLAAISMFRVVSALPATGETNTIYIVKPAGQATGPYEEYIWVDNAWEKIGDTDIQLENYYKKSEIGGTWTESNTLIDYVDAADTTLDGRLDTVEGKLVGLPAGETIEQAIEAAVAAEETRATGVEGTLSNLTTDAKGNLVAAVNEVDAHANTAQATADSALATAGTAVQTVTGDANIDASKSGTTVTVGVKVNSDLANLLAACTLTTEEE